MVVPGSSPDQARRPASPLFAITGHIKYPSSDSSHDCLASCFGVFIDANIAKCASEIGQLSRVNASRITTSCQPSTPSYLTGRHAHDDRARLNRPGDACAGPNC